MKTIEVVAAIIRGTQEEKHKILATQRGYGEFQGKWEFPGGKMEEGETKEEALIREIQEEMATKIAIHCHVCTVEYDYPTFHLIMHCYLCDLVSGKLELLEHSAAKWLSKEELDSVDWLPADIEVIEKLRGYME